VELNGRTYKNHLDSYNQLDDLGGKSKESPRKEFLSVNGFRCALSGAGVSKPKDKPNH